jgi:hypothetical protein
MSVSVPDRWRSTVLVLGVVIFAAGAALATVAGFWQFAAGAILLLIAGVAQAVYGGMPFGQAAFGAAGYFVCGQLGYVAGAGIRALVAAKTRRIAEAAVSKPALSDSYETLPRQSEL